MADTIGLNGLITLEEEKRLQESVAGRIAFVHGHEVGPGRGTDFRVFVIGLIRDLAKDLLAHLAGREFQRKAIGERTFQRRVVQEAGVDKPAEQGFVTNGFVGLFADPMPDRIDGSHSGFGFKHRRVSGFGVLIPHPEPEATRNSVRSFIIC